MLDIANVGMATPGTPIAVDEAGRDAHESFLTWKSCLVLWTVVKDEVQEQVWLLL